MSEKSVPQENRSAMEEICRSSQNATLERLRSTVECDGREWLGLGHAMQTVYTNLTESRQVFEDEAEACKPTLPIFI